MNELSRRTMLAAGGAALSLGAANATATALTASDVIARIKAHVGVPWLEKTVDGIIAGDGAIDWLSRREHVLHPDLAVLLSTSGSTGSAKLVKLSA